VLLAAATATTHGDVKGRLILLGLVLLVAAGYALACWWWPFTSCPRCKGTGRSKSPTGKNWRKCRRCKGTATRVRLGRRVFNWLQVTKEGTER
jgi:hypothetical protein